MSAKQLNDEGEYVLVSQEVLEECLIERFNRREPVILKGPPGCGKTAMPIQIATRFGLPMTSPFNCALSDGTDGKGLPRFSDNRSSQIWVKDVRWLEAAEAPSLVLIDEVGQGNDGVVAFTVPVFREKRVDDLYLHPDTWVVGTTNRAQDKCGSRPLPKQLLDGVYKYEVTYSAEALVKYELENHANDIDILTIRYLRMKGDSTFSYDPAKEINSTMRGWSVIMRLLHDAPKTRYENIAGRVGRGLATELMAFRSLAPSLPSQEDVLMNPKTAKMPDNVSAQFLITDMLADIASATNFDALVEYAKRMPPEMQAKFVKDSLVRSPEVASTTAFVKWGVNFAEVLR